MTEDDNTIRQLVESAPEIAGDEPNEERDLRLFKFRRNDYGNAQRLLARFGADIIFVRNSGWHVWDGKRWARDEGGTAAHKLAHRTAEAIYHEAKRARKSSPHDLGVSEDAHEKLVDKHSKWALTSGNSQRIKAMLAEALPYVLREQDQLDTDPLLFNVENGTIDLRLTVRGEAGGDDAVSPLREHRRKDYITRCAPVEYRPERLLGTFRTFLNRIMPDGGEQEFIQTYLGYSLSGKMTEKKMLLCHGGSNNGKSTLMQAIMNVFGEGQYAMTLQFESLQLNERRGANDATPDIARLPGMRFVVAAEPESGVKLSTSMIKKMTSIESVNARHLNQGFFTFKPEFKLALSFNDKPVIPAQDDGTWNRLLLLHFGQTISPEERDPDIDAKLDAEKSAILNWLLDGYRIWEDKGLQPPVSVTNSTLEYRDENDDVGVFIRKNIVPAAGVNTTAKAIFKAYCGWCDEKGTRPWSQRKLGQRLTQMGFKRRISGTVEYENVKLADYAKEYLGSSTTSMWEEHDEDA